MIELNSCLAQDVQLSDWDFECGLFWKTRGMFTIPGVHGPARGKVYRNCFQSFQEGETTVITRLWEQISNKTRTNPACFLAGGMGTDLFDHENHERHEKMGFSSVSCFSWLKSRLGFHWGGLLLGSMLLLGLGGCATSPDAYLDEFFEESSLYKSGDFFMEHPSPLVGVPATLVTAPTLTITLSIALIAETANSKSGTDKFDRIMWGCVPPVKLMYVSADLVGAPCWALFGWWWPEEHNHYPDEGSLKTEKNGFSESSETPDGCKEWGG